MSYLRVIPRDLFNEANLFKCLGQLALLMETLDLPGVELEHDGSAFDVDQDPDSGAICVLNVELVRGPAHYRLYRPLNSRRSWPLYLYPDSDTEIEVFDEQGALHPLFLAWLRNGDQP